MNFIQAQKIWRDWQSEKVSEKDVLHLCHDIAASFISSSFKRKQEDLRYIDLLCEMAMASHVEVAHGATVTIFSEIIEILCDDFSDAGVDLCCQVLLRILAYVRKRPEGRELDYLLRDKGLETTGQLLKRFKKISRQAPMAEGRREKVKKIIILSRVTAGADIAITAIVISRLRKSFPKAELVLIGPGHLHDMFGQTPKCRFVPFIYKNDGSLVEKMTTWPALLSLVTKESHACGVDEILLFDTDTRLSQLGLLPLTSDENTMYFPSRTTSFPGTSQKNLSALTNQWLNQILQENKPPEAYLLFSRLEKKYSSFRDALRENGCKFIITINFGVGNDPIKKIDPNFELTLLHDLLKTPETVLILDNGCGDEERQRATHHIQVLKQFGFNTSTFSQGEKVKKTSMNHGIISHQGPLGDLGKFIKVSDCFIGYDSCGQHIASAAGTPSVIIFAGAPSERFVARWSPNNLASTTIPIYRHSKLGKKELDSLLKNVVEAVSQIRKKLADATGKK